MTGPTHGAMIELLGHPTWAMVSDHHTETLVLLHGGLSNSDALLESIGSHLGTTYRLAAFDRRGHGRTSDTSAPLHYRSMAEETIAFLEHLGGGTANLVGWSDGGIIGLLVAMRRPDLVSRLVMIGSNFHHDGLRALEMDPDGPEVEMLMSEYATRSPDGAEHFGVIVEKTLTMFATEPTLTTTDLASLTVPVLVLAADDDLIELAHTCALYESLPEAQLAIVPGSSHALPLEQPEEVARIVTRFLSQDVPPVTLMPSRRRH